MTAYLERVLPVLPVKDVKEALKYYVNNLGFEISFADDKNDPHYAGIKRDNVVIHLQWHDPKEWSAVERPMLRFLCRDIDDLYEEYKSKAVFHKLTSLKDTAWSTREFAFYDLYKNGLTFYIDL